MDRNTRSKPQRKESLPVDNHSTGNITPSPTMELILEKLSALDCIPKQLAELTVKVSEVQKCVEYNSGQLDEVLQTTTEHGEEIKRLKSELQKQTKVNHDLTKRMSEIEERQIQHELYSRKNNLLFDGIRETEDEDCLKIVSDLITNILKLPVDARDLHRIYIGLVSNSTREELDQSWYVSHATVPVMSFTKRGQHFTNPRQIYGLMRIYLVK